MGHRALRGVGILAVTLSTAIPVGAQTPASGTQTTTTPTAKRSSLKTPWGVPDLSGTWDRHTITPLERNKNNDGKAELSDEEVASLEAETADRNDVDKNRQVGTDADVGRAYNQFWWDRPTKTTGNRTALIVDPPDGRIPALTPAAEERR